MKQEENVDVDCHFKLSRSSLTKVIVCVVRRPILLGEKRSHVSAGGRKLTTHNAL